MLVLLLLIFFILNNVVADMHAPDTPPKILREEGWCDNGSITATTGECICSTHLGYFCQSDGDSSLQSGSTQSESCQSGFGMSFFHNSCVNCKCDLSKAWQERKKSMRQNQRKQQSQFQKG
jgi:hypothetical protein